MMDNRLLPQPERCIPVNSRAQMYGEGCFDTFRTYRGSTLHLADHLERLQSGLEAIGIGLPDGLEEEQRLAAGLYRLLQSNNLLEADAIVRIQAWRSGNRGYRLTGETESHFTMTAHPLTGTEESIQLSSVDVRRIPDASLPSRYKFTNGLNYILAARQAAALGGDDAVMLTNEEKVSETTIANIFWRNGNVIFTPSKECDLLPGITRGIIIKLLNDMDDITLTQGQFAIEQLLDADVVWVCNSVREVQPVAGIDGVSFPVADEFFRRLTGAFRDYRNSNLVEIGKNG